MKKIFYVLIIFLFSSCAVSIGNAKKYLPEVNKFISEKKVLVFEFGELDYISENNKYGRVVYEIPEITQNIVQTGTVIGYVQRPANDENPQRWSQLPQFSAGQDNPTYVYFSFGEGIIRVSLQSATSIESAAEYFKDKKLKFIISN
ncbi:MAG: hypothetical protein ISQ41_06880 [Flavobacteriaceae bacterium]|nr:hypothetical protein [Flavobacteriaceae bacterium]MBL6685172.1 hypothetical protein [Flavobacteriaceae bacterium]